MTHFKHSMDGKICLVTGATSGIGAVTARALAERGATVVVLGRSRNKAAATTGAIQAQTGNPDVDFLLADLASQEEVHGLAQAFRRHYPRLDVLVNNAGAFFMLRQESADGIELTLALNHLAYFLLTHLLLDVLQASAPVRIVNVSSYGHARARINFDDLQARQRYNGMAVYRQSKLANVLFTYELARRLAGTGVTVNALNPGLVATNFGLNNFGLSNNMLVGLFRRAYRLAAISAEEGAQTSIYLATSAEVEGVTGKYFDKQKAVPSSPASYDQAAGLRLWEMSAGLVGLPC